jgi:hypothetical protein
VGIAIPAIGTPKDLAAEMLAQYGKVDLIIVPYNGIAKAIPDVMENRAWTWRSAPSLRYCLRSAAGRCRHRPRYRRNGLRSRPKYRLPRKRDYPRCGLTPGFAS